MSTSLNTKRIIIGILSIAFLIVLLFAIFKETQRQIPGYKSEPVVDKSTQHCISCHGEKGEGKIITEQWKGSEHANVGVGCIECHKAEKGDKDGYEHHGDFIATIVTPNDCARCHEEESEQFQASYHADAGAIMGSLDNVLAEVVEGHAAYKDGANPAAAAGCWQCHGSRIELLLDDSGEPIKNDEGVIQFDPKTWPNTGIGRINLDGSKGSCSACHNRHSFDVAQVRQPENCGKCHMGPDHPQIEIYNESKHGINFRAHKNEMNLDAQPWIVGEDYTAAPTCATCHLSATPDQPVTHEVGSRISWTLRPKVSEKIDMSQLRKFKKQGKSPPADFLNWEERRDNMKNVCHQCHTNAYVENFYTQFDNQINLYNDKFGKPGLALFKALKKNNLLTARNFDEPFEWDYFLMWHHQGRRARHGAAMMGPDYTQWHGNFEIAETFYTQMVPEAKELIEKAKKNGNAAGAKEAEKVLDEILNSEMHKWYLGKMNPEEAARRKEASKKFRERYDH